MQLTMQYISITIYLIKKQVWHQLKYGPHQVQAIQPSRKATLGVVQPMYLDPKLQNEDKIPKWRPRS
jgi:hypothetical protein